MSVSLRQRLNELAASFSAGVLEALRSASLEELLAESSSVGGKSRGKSGLRSIPSLAADMGDGASRKRTGRLPRRSAGDIGQMVDRIVELVKGSAEGMRAEAIRQKLGLEAKELPRPLKEGVEAGRLSKVGQKRATTYFAVDGGAESGAASAKVAVRAAARRGRTPADGGEEAAEATPAKRAKRSPKRGSARKAGKKARVARKGRARKKG
jgi:hypothetical protein